MKSTFFSTLQRSMSYVQPKGLLQNKRKSAELTFIELLMVQETRRQIGIVLAQFYRLIIIIFKLKAPSLTECHWPA